MRFLAALLALTLPAFAQIRYSPTGFTAPFISTVTNQASAQAYLGISGGGGGSVTNFGGSATNLQVYSSGTTNQPLRVYGTNGTSLFAVTVDGYAMAKRPPSQVPGFFFEGDSTTGLGSVGAGELTLVQNGANAVRIQDTWGVTVAGNLGFGYDSYLARSSAGVIEINNGTARQYRDLRLRTLEGFYSYTDASNYQGFKLTNGATSVTLAAQTAGTGADDVDLYLRSAGRNSWISIEDGNARIDQSTYGGGYLFDVTFNYTPLFRVATGLSLVGLGHSMNIVWHEERVGTTQDTGISRTSAGLVQINNGTAGQYRDLVTRSTFATNASITNITADSYVTTQQTLSYASATNLTVDANKSLHFVSLTNTAYFAQPSNLGVGRTFTVILQQDGTGTRAVTFNTNYWKFPGGVVPTITTNANAYDVLSCISCPYGTNVFAIHNAKFQ